MADFLNLLEIKFRKVTFTSIIAVGQTFKAFVLSFDLQLDFEISIDKILCQGCLFVLTFTAYLCIDR